MWPVVRWSRTRAGAAHLAPHTPLVGAGGWYQGMAEVQLLPHDKENTETPLIGFLGTGSTQSFHQTPKRLCIKADRKRTTAEIESNR